MRNPGLYLQTLLPAQGAARWTLLWGILTASVSATAQVVSTPENVVQLSATAQQEVVQDWLTVVLVVRHQATEASAVQSHLKTALDRALSQARSKAGLGLEVSTGAFTVQPRHGREGQIVGWQGSAELLLQGRDLAKLAALAGETTGMVVSQMYFSVSREASQRVEADVRQQAIVRFKNQAQQIAQDFGFKGYTVREVAVSEAGLPPAARPRLMVAAEMGAAVSAAPLPAEPGKSLVQVTVSGSVQMK
jgi:predicted secreted protein